MGKKSFQITAEKPWQSCYYSQRIAAIVRNYIYYDLLDFGAIVL